MQCNGRCMKYKATRPYMINGQRLGHYIVGNKRCRVCGIFMRYEGKYCPCCNTILRTKPRLARTKRRLKAAKKEYDVIIDGQTRTETGIAVQVHKAVKHHRTSSTTTTMTTN